MAPLAHLSVRVAKLAILIVNHLCILSILYILLVRICRFTLREAVTLPLPALIAVYFFSFRGTHLTIETAQMNLLILLLLCLSWWALKSDRPAWMIAAPLALATIFKIFPVILLALLVIHKKYRATAMTIAFLLVLSLASYALLPRQLWTDWARHVAPTCGYFKNPLGVVPPTLAGNVGVSAFIGRFCLPGHFYTDQHVVAPAPWPHPRIGLAITYLVIGLLVLTTLVGAYVSRTESRTDRQRSVDNLDVAFSAFLALIFLASPLAWEHHLVYLLPATIVCLVGIFGAEESGRARRWDIVILAATCLLAWPLLPGRDYHLGLAAIQFLTAMKLGAALLIWGWIVANLLLPTVRRRKTMTPESILVAT